MPEDKLFGATLLTVAQQVNKLGAFTSLKVHIRNNIGGVLDDALDIYNYLIELKKERGITITTVGEKLVASAATVIYMAGDKRILMGPTCDFMIHMPWGGIEGTSSDIEGYLDYMKKLDKQILDFYKDTVGISEAVISPLLLKETWLSPLEAYNLGFATEKPINVKLSADRSKHKIKNVLKMKDKKQEAAGLFAKIRAMLSGKAKPTEADKKKRAEEAKAAKLKKEQAAKGLVTYTAADGSELEFSELEEGQTPSEGDLVTIAGADADGEFVLPQFANMVIDVSQGVIIGVTEGEEEQPGEEAENAAAEEIAAEVEDAIAEVEELITELVEAAETATATAATNLAEADKAKKALAALKAKIATDSPNFKPANAAKPKPGDAKPKPGDTKNVAAERLAKLTGKK